MIEAPIMKFKTKKLMVESLQKQSTTYGKRRRTKCCSNRGRCIGASKQNSSGKPHLMQSVIAQAACGAGFEHGINSSELRWQIFRRRAGANIIFIVDSSGSMLQKRRIEMAKGCVFSLLEESYVSRDTVSLVSFGGESAELVLPPTSSVELASQKLKLIRTGGKTPLLDALTIGLRLMERSVGTQTLFVLVSDGKYSRGGFSDPEARIRGFGEAVFRRGGKILLVDAEEKNIFSFDAAKRLAKMIGAVYVPINELRADMVRSAADAFFKI